MFSLKLRPFLGKQVVSSDREEATCDFKVLVQGRFFNDYSWIWEEE